MALNDDVPGEPQKSVSTLPALNLVLSPKSHNFRLMHFPLSLSKVNRIFSGLISALKGKKFFRIRNYCCSDGFMRELFMSS